MTLAEFTSHFVPFSTTRCKPTTLHLYADLPQRFVVPRLGSHDLRRITTADIVSFHSSLVSRRRRLTVRRWW